MMRMRRRLVRMRRRRRRLTIKEGYFVWLTSSRWIPRPSHLPSVLLILFWFQGFSLLLIIFKFLVGLIVIGLCCHFSAICSPYFPIIFWYCSRLSNRKKSSSLSSSSPSSPMWEKCAMVMWEWSLSFVKCNPRHHHHHHHHHHHPYRCVLRSLQRNVRG